MTLLLFSENVPQKDTHKNMSVKSFRYKQQFVFLIESYFYI